MKATNNITRISRISMILCSAITIGTSLCAQPFAGLNFGRVGEASSRLETLMANTEEAIKYVPPSVENVEINEAMESLELLANNIEMAIRYEAPEMETAELNEAIERLEELASNFENEIRYRVPNEEQTPAVEFASEQNKQENETPTSMISVVAFFKNK
jgi:hypothetical protein